MITLEPVLLNVPAEAGDLPVCLVRVISDDDVSYGEALLADPDLLPVATDFFADAVAHANPLDFGLIWQRLLDLVREYEPDPPEAYMAVLGAIDVALWDLAGRRLNVPCHRLAGGLRSARIDCYGGGLSVDQPDLDKAAVKLRDGFGAVGLRLSGDARRDVPAIHRLRRALGEMTPIMCDAGPGYGDPEAARQVGEAIEQTEGFFYENPLPAGQWAETARLREKLGTGLSGGRFLSTLAEYDQALQADAFDIVVADLRRCGGLSAARALAEMTHWRGVRMTLHAGQSPLAQIAGSHLAAAYWHIGPLQVEPLSPASQELVGPAPQFTNGFLMVPGEPGLGSRISEEAVQRYQVEWPDEHPS